MTHCGETPTNGIRIEADLWYLENLLRIAGLDEDDLRKGRDAGSLRFTQLSHGRIYKGAWVIRWLEGPKAETSSKPVRLIDLDQAAAWVKRSRSCLRHYKDLPPPTVKGRRGQRQLWDWSILRPWLERTFGMRLHEEVPSFKRRKKRSNKAPEE